ncbi:MAG: anti-sigma F factor [Ruminococcaceae bacterium]|nr:anti-sigma F factor [Oscillospiraceae bacterium]
MRLVIDSRSANESFARVAVAAFIAQLDPTVEEISDIKTAVSEAVTNCIVHGYRNGIGSIWIQARIYSDSRVMLRVRDKGAGISDIKQAMEPLFTTGGAERGGLGFTVMESFMDDLKVHSVVGKGTTVTMEKKIVQRR